VPPASTISSIPVIGCPDRSVFARYGTIGVCLLALAVIVLQQWRSGAFAAEYTAHADEAAHYVTGVMIHDYIRAGLRDDPVQFAEQFYVHYPKVAFGIWPPAFHVAEAVWMLLFSTSRVSVLLFVGLAGVVAAAVIYRGLAKRTGPFLAAFVACLFVTLPPVQKASGVVMMDLWLAALTLWAAMLFGRYLETESWKYSAAFGAVAALACMTKYNAVALVAVPPIALLLTRRFHLIKQRTFWLPVAIVVAVCGPWYLAMQGLVGYAMEPVPGMEAVGPALTTNAALLFKGVGAALALLAMTGFAVLVVVPALLGRAVAPFWAVMTGQIAGVYLFHSLAYPSFEDRYLLPALPAILALAATGAKWATERWSHSVWTAVVVLAIAHGVLSNQTLYAGPPRSDGYAQIADAIVRTPLSSVALVSGEPEQEGGLIAEVVSREIRPTHIVLRASKLLASMTWTGGQYRVKYDSAAAVLRTLDDVNVGSVVVYDTAMARAHEQQLQRAMRDAGPQWRITFENRIADQPNGWIRLYQRSVAPQEASRLRTLLPDVVTPFRKK
jgi:hypothetical protein